MRLGNGALEPLPAESGPRKKGLKKSQKKARKKKNIFISREESSVTAQACDCNDRTTRSLIGDPRPDLP